MALGNFYLQQGKTDKAEQAYLKITEFDSKNKNGYMVLARFYEIIGKNDKERAIYQKALDLFPEDIGIKMALAAFYLKTRELDTCEKLVGKMLEDHPKFANALLIQSELLILKGKTDEAISILDSLIKDKPNLAKAYYFRGFAHFMKGQMNFAKADISKAEEIAPRYLKAKLLLADIYYKEQSLKLAQKQFEKIVRLQPDHYQAILMLGNIYFKQGKAEETQKQYERLIEIQPKNATGYYRLGLIYGAMKKNDLAMENFEKALAINPKLIDAFYQVVMIQISEKKPNMALETCEKQMEVVKDSPAAQAIVKFMEGQVFQSWEKPQDAKTAYKQSQQLYEDYLPPYYALAKMYIRSGEADQAIAEYKKLLNKNPKLAGAHMSLGVIYDMKKMPALSEQHYRKALDIKPDFVAAAKNLAYNLAKSGKDLNEALELARKAKEIQPEQADVIDTLGLVYLKKGLYDNAIIEFSDGLEKQPDNPIINYHLGLAFYKKDEKEKAKSALERALSLNSMFDGAEDAKRILKDIIDTRS